MMSLDEEQSTSESVCLCRKEERFGCVCVSMSIIPIEPAKDRFFLQMRDSWFNTQLCTVSVKASFFDAQLCFTFNVLYHSLRQYSNKYNVTNSI